VEVVGIRVRNGGCRIKSEEWRGQLPGLACGGKLTISSVVKCPPKYNIVGLLLGNLNIFKIE
jgi:hypothetical protein